MSRILYKRLFEVRILHDYFLSKTDGTSIFDLTPAQKAAFLEEKVHLDQYNVRQFLEIYPSESTQQLFKDYRLKIAPEASGFVVGIEVKSQNLPSGEEIYFPFIKGIRGKTLGFKLTLPALQIKNATNSKLRTPASYQYYFSNQNAEGSKTFPFLSVPVADFQAGTTYETGELAVLTGNLSQALEETNTANLSKWQAINGIGLVNEQDRILLGKQFLYRLPNPTTHVEATLKDLSGLEIKKISFSQTAAFTNLYLDFRQQGQAEEAEDIADGSYQLEVRADGIVVEKKIIKLSDALYQRSQLGAVEIFLDENDANFRLFNTDGSLISKKNADNTLVAHPVFEILLKRRSTYWCYLSASGKNLAVTPKSALFLTEDSGKLKTKDLKPLTHYPMEFQSDDPATAAVNERVFLPNPLPNAFRKENNRLFSDIYVSPIKGLILEN